VEFCDFVFHLHTTKRYKYVFSWNADTKL